VYTFHLRPGFKFWNGRSINAADVKYSFERVLAPETRSPQTWVFEPLLGAQEFMEGKAKEVAGLQVLDSLTLRLELSTPFAPYLGFLGMPAAAIVPREEVEKAGATFGEHPVGSGPWIFDGWKRDGYVRFKRNPHYYFGAPQVEGILIRMIPEVLTAVVEFEAGNLDVMTVPMSEFTYWTHSRQWKPYIHTLEELAFYYIALNCSRPPFDNPRMRLAVSLAIDREKIVRRIFHGSMIPARGAIPPGLPGYDPQRPPLAFNPDSARKILEEEGYGAGCEFDLWADQTAALSQVLEAVQAYLNDVGFKCRLVRNDWNVMRDAMRKGRTDAYWGNWYADYADAENFLAPLFLSRTAALRNRYHNPKVDRLIERLQRTPDDSLRADLARQVDSILVAETAYVFLWYPITYTIHQPWVKSYAPRLMPNAQKYLEVKLVR